MKASGIIDRNSNPGDDILRTLKYIFFINTSPEQSQTVNKLLFAMTLFQNLLKIKL